MERRLLVGGIETLWEDCDLLGRLRFVGGLELHEEITGMVDAAESF
jgi:hypothetical protein